MWCWIYSPVRARIDRDCREISFYSTLPAFADVVLDRDRNLWVRKFPLPGQDRGEWLVLGIDGSLRAVAMVPIGSKLLAAACDRTLVQRESEDGGEQVLQFRLEKPEP